MTRNCCSAGTRRCRYGEKANVWHDNGTARRFGPDARKACVNKNSVDVSQVFLVYMALVGDVPKVALALDMAESDVEEMAEREGWADKVRRISVMSKSGKPGDWEKAQNRALNFVQCHQLRRTVDGVIAHLASQSAVELLEKRDAHGNVQLSARIFSDLAKSMQTIHEMTYSALGDTVRERTPDGAGEGTALTSAALHASLIGALNQAKLKDATPETLVKEAVVKVEELKSANP